MQIVINIPEKDYKNLRRKDKFNDMCLNYYERLIVHGTPLPKSHGDLIDVKELRQDIIAHKYSIDFCKEHNIDQSIDVGMLNILLADASIIIEADKTESEE